MPPGRGGKSLVTRSVLAPSGTATSGTLPEARWIRSALRGRDAADRGDVPAQRRHLDDVARLRRLQEATAADVDPHVVGRVLEEHQVPGLGLGWGDRETDLLL